MELINILRNTGLKKKEARVYLATLELGESTVLPISRKSGIQRTYCYDILDSLSKKGLVSFVEKRGRRRYIATDPTNIKSELEKRKKQFGSSLPQLLSLYKKSSHKPKVRYYEGHNGIETIHKEILREADRVLIISTMKEWIKEFPDYEEYVYNQVKRGIKISELTHYHKEVKDYTKYYQEPKQKLRHLPKKIKLSNDIFIWGNKVALISYAKELIAIVIESKQISNTHKQIFQVLWDMSK